MDPWWGWRRQRPRRQETSLAPGRFNFAMDLHLSMVGGHTAGAIDERIAVSTPDPSKVSSGKLGLRVDLGVMA